MHNDVEFFMRECFGLSSPRQDTVFLFLKSSLRSVIYRHSPSASTLTTDRQA